MIIDKIKAANIQAMKDRDANLRGIYSVLINKYMQAEINARTSNQDVDDAETVRIIQKTTKELEDEIENYKKANNQERAKLVTLQKTEIEKYLPKMLSRDEIKSIIISLPDKSIPFVMRYFKEHYSGKCDMRDVQAVLKSI